MRSKAILFGIVSYLCSVLTAIMGALMITAEPGGFLVHRAGITVLVLAVVNVICLMGIVWESR